MYLHFARDEEPEPREFSLSTGTNLAQVTSQSASSPTILLAPLIGERGRHEPPANNPSPAPAKHRAPGSAPRPRRPQTDRAAPRPCESRACHGGRSVFDPR